jgi:hypothetical protein
MSISALQWLLMTKMILLLKTEQRKPPNATSFWGESGSSSSWSSCGHLSLNQSSCHQHRLLHLHQEDQLPK